MKSFLKFSALHLFISASLFVFSQFSFLIVLQFLFCIALFDLKNSTLLFTYLMGLNYALALFFSFEAYLLYFVAFFGTLTFLYTQNISFSKKDIFASGVLAFGTLFGLWHFEEFFYDMYISLDIVDAQNYINGEVLFFLTLLHLFVLFFILFKKNRELFGI